MSATANERRAETRRLIRPDGTRWTVSDLRVEDCCFQVTARRVDDENGNGQREVIRDRPLERGDRLVWLNERGEVVWSARCPVGRLS